MYNTLRSVPFKYLKSVSVSVPVMNDNRQVKVFCKLKLSFKEVNLFLTRSTVIIVIVKSYFTYGNRLLLI